MYYYRVKVLTHFVLFVIVLCAIVILVAESRGSEPLLSMSTQEFDLWIESKRIRRSADGETTILVGNELRNRLRAGLWVPDETIANIVLRHIRLEASSVERDREQPV